MVAVSCMVCALPTRVKQQAAEAVRRERKTKALYEVHPYTGNPIQGFQFPYWEEAMDMVKQAAGKIEGMAYIGWDVAFTPDGPKIVEGNNFPGHDIYQLPEHTPDRIGMMPKFNV